MRTISFDQPQQHSADHATLQLQASRTTSRAPERRTKEVRTHPQPPECKKTDWITVNGVRSLYAGPERSQTIAYMDMEAYRTKKLGIWPDNEGQCAIPSVQPRKHLSSSRARTWKFRDGPLVMICSESKKTVRKYLSLKPSDDEWRQVYELKISELEGNV